MVVSPHELELMKRYGRERRRLPPRPASQPSFICEMPTVNDGCIYCGKYRNASYRLLWKRLRFHLGLRSLCRNCKDEMIAEVEKTSTAFHEAGHAVMLIALGRRFKYISVKARWVTGGKSAGHVMRRSTPLSELGEEHAIKKQAFVSLAGYEAERILHGRHYKQTRVHKQLVRMVERQTLPPGHDYFEFNEVFGNYFALYEGIHGLWCSTVREDLLLRWSQVEKLAIALLNGSDTLTYEQVLTLLGLPR